MAGCTLLRRQLHEISSVSRRRVANLTYSHNGKTCLPRPALRLHHVEMCVTHGKPVTSYFCNKLGFSLLACRTTPSSLQWVLNAGNSTFLVTERQQRLTSTREPFETQCCENLTHHSVNSVFNVALEVYDVDSLTQRALDLGSNLIHPPVDISDSWGTVRYSIVGSCCGNIIHTLLDKKYYEGPFLPMFVAPNTASDEIQVVRKPVTTHLDHVTYVCRPGESQSIIDWYGKVFGMQRFMTNRLDDPFEGLKIDAPIGMRLKAMNYWRCAENGIQSSGEESESMLRIVLAESLAECPNGHIEAFLDQHRGPGVQHIALHSPSLPNAVQTMTDNGIMFRSPPNAYYRKEKEEEIKKADESPEVFKRLGILIDSEADADAADVGEDKFLLQIFTMPLFDEETFFLEVAQRKGAKGFGSGNVTALARSIDEQRKLDQARNLVTAS